MDININIEDLENEVFIKKNIYIDCLAQYIKTIDKQNNIKFISYTFFDSIEQIKLNSKHLSHNYNTDIITFDIGTNDIIGDIYISCDKILENSIEYKTNIVNEFNRVIIHGPLHLLGFDDKNDKDKSIMRKEEEKYLDYLKLCSTRNFN